MPTDKRERQRASRAAAREAAKAAQRRRATRNRAIAIAVIVALLVLLLAVFAGRGGDDTTDVGQTADDTTTTTGAAAPAAFGTTPCPPAGGADKRTTKFEDSFENCLADGKDYSAVIQTDVGSVTVDLLEDEAPVTVNNFVALARHRAYEGVPFHRVIPDFVVQGGDVANGNGTGDAGYKFGDELPEPGDYKEGSLAMANSGPNTNGSQFFIVTSAAGAKTLVEAVGGSANYSLFGQVTEGMDVVKKIEADGSPSGTPATVHKILTVTIKEA